MKPSSAPTCSVIVRCYNEQRHIGRLLDGIFHQTVEDIEIVVVDSGSTDRTVEIAQRYPVKVVEIRKEDFSFGYSLNVGCQHARGDYLVLASAHVYPTYDDWLEQLLEPFADPEVALVYGRQVGNEVTRFSERQVFRSWFPEQSEREQPHPFCNNANAAVRRSVWEKLPYDEALTGLEDIAWAKAAMARGHRITYAAEAEVVHVHEETPMQIFRRYEREAIALKAIYPHNRSSLWTFLRLVSSTVFSDWRQALREGVLARNFFDVLVFRALQFWGAYWGNSLHGPISDQLRMRLYYPVRGTDADSDAGRSKARPIHYIPALHGDRRGPVG